MSISSIISKDLRDTKVGDKTIPHGSRNGKKISRITIHHAAGNIGLQALAEWFATSEATCSSTYGIDSYGAIGLIVDEQYKPYTSSSSANDEIAVTIEVANNSGEPNWTVSDAAYNSLISLCIDICQRNGIERLEYTGDKNNPGNLTRHDYFFDKVCPGPYLGSKFEDIASKVNKALKSNKPSNKKVFIPRTSNPIGTSDAKYYTNNPYGVSGSSRNGDGCYGMPNCVCYAWGRFWELMDKNGISERPKLSTGNAKDWYGNTNDGYLRGTEPKVGAVCCWWRDDEPDRERGGHVAIVEAIEKKDDGSYKIVTSESAY